MYNQYDFNIKNSEKSTLKHLASSFGFALLISSAFQIIIAIIETMYMLLIKNNEIKFITKQLFLAIESVMLLLPIGFLTYKSYIPEKKYILPFKKNSPKTTILTTIFGLGVSFCAQIISAIVQNVIDAPSPQIDYKNSLFSILVSIFSISIVPAVVEEITFRGVMLGSLRRYGDKFAIFMSALLFGILHGNVSQSIFAFILGITFGYMTIKTNSLLPSIIVHMLNNLLSVLIGSGILNSVIYFLLGVVITIQAIIISISLSIKDKNFLNIDDTTICYLNSREKIKAFFENSGIIIFMVLYLLIIVLNYTKTRLFI